MTSTVHNRDLAPTQPHDPRAEKALLGAVLLEACTFEEVRNAVSSIDFYDSRNRKLFLCMSALSSEGIRIDEVSLTDRLQARGDGDAVLADGYLALLTDGLPRTANIQQWAQIVREKSKRRQLLDLADSLGHRIQSGIESPNEIIERATQELSRLRPDDARDWRSKFHTVAELPEGDVAFLIDRVLPQGVTFIGASSGVGKTWFALSLARALVTGTKFLGVWTVARPQNILYLCPEMQVRPFKNRCSRLGINGDRFRCQTVADGAPLNLSDPLLLVAIRELQPALFLDTSIRFSDAENENSATENQGLARAIFALLHAGAKAVVCLHHRSKDAGREELTLENSLRGSSDLGAIADAVYGLRHDQLGGDSHYLQESRSLVRLQVRCVKGRDFSPVPDFRVQLNPFLDRQGDFAVLADEPIQTLSEAEKLAAAIQENPKSTKMHLQQVTGIGRNKIGKLAATQGWQYRANTGWTKHA